MTCPKCGNELSATMKFCAKCGTAVAQQQVQQQPPVAPETPAQPPQNVPNQQPPVVPNVAPAQPSVQANVPAPQNTPEKKKKDKPKGKKKNLGLKITAIVLVLAVLLTGGLWIFDNEMYKSDMQEATEYITDFPVLKQKTELTVIDSEKFPVEKYNIRVERMKMGGILKSGKLVKNETIIDETTTDKVFEIDFEKDGEYKITLTEIVASRTQATQPSEKEENTAAEKRKDEEPIVIIIVASVDNDDEEAQDTVTLDSKEGEEAKTAEEEENGTNQATEPTGGNTDESTEPSESTTPTESTAPTESTTPTQPSGGSGINQNAQVGSYITFGEYEQDGNTSNGKEAIEWLVLDVQDGKALVISKYALDCKQYNEEYEEVTWETCTLRTWLNNEFYNTAFSNSEKNKISTTNVVAEDNPSYSTEAGNNTQDKVFLLSISEAEAYFSSDDERCCKPTQYAIDNGAYVYDEPSSSYDGNCWWWLRSPGDSQDLASYVNYFGGVISYGRSVDYSLYAVRPVLWVNL